MALVTDKFVFAHLPKTGGKFVRHVVEWMDIPHQEIGNFHAAPIAVTREGCDLPTIISIRHPVTWYQSRWMHRIKYGWSAEHPVDWVCASNDFNVFVNNVIEYDPNGRLTSLVQLFLRKAKPNINVDYVLKNENLRNQLYGVLVDLGYNINRDLYNNIAEINVSGKPGQSSSDVAIYNSETFDRLINHERWLIDTYYDGIIDPKDLGDQFVV